MASQYRVGGDMWEGIRRSVLIIKAIIDLMIEMDDPNVVRMWYIYWKWNGERKQVENAPF